MPFRLWMEYEPGNEPPRWRDVVAVVVIILGVLSYLGFVIITR